MCNQSQINYNKKLIQLHEIKNNEIYFQKLIFLLVKKMNKLSTLDFIFYLTININ